MSSAIIPEIASKHELVAPSEGARLCRLSPDGKRIAYCADDGVSAALWVAPSGSDEARSVVRLGDAAVDELRWSPGGEHLAYVTGRGLPVGAEREVGWASLEGGELGRAPGSAFCWGVTKPALVLASPTRSALLHVDVATGETLALCQLYDDGHLGYPPHVAIAADGRHVACSRRSAFQELSEVWLCRRVKDADQPSSPSGDVLTQIPGADVRIRLLWSPKGKSLALCIAHETIAQTAIVVVRNLKGEGEALHHHDGLDALEPAWSPDGRWIALFCCMTGAQRLSLLDVHDRQIYPLAGDIAPGPLHFIGADRLAVGGGAKATLLRLRL